MKWLVKFRVNSSPRNRTEVPALFNYTRLLTLQEKMYNFLIALKVKMKDVILFRYVVGSKSLRPDIQKPRQMENAVGDI